MKVFKTFQKQESSCKVLECLYNLTPPNSVILLNHCASLIAQLIKNLPAMQETLVKFLGQEDPLEKG